MLHSHWSFTELEAKSLRELLSTSTDVPDVPDVVVVDDDPDMREALGRVLESWGYRVRLAEDGATGLALILESPPGVAVVDIAMPRLDGYALAREVRAALGGSGPKLVALTSFGRQGDRRHALASGFDVHLTKPARLGQLRKAIESGCQKRRRYAEPGRPATPEPVYGSP
jgi:CheY-like chemotaxis protein